MSLRVKLTNEQLSALERMSDEVHGREEQLRLMIGAAKDLLKADRTDLAIEAANATVTAAEEYAHAIRAVAMMVRDIDGGSPGK